MSEGVPYLGSKISLISKSEIRYEGILYTIDTNESTVALAKVRSFGTEGRPTDRPVSGRNEVYDYIIFRGRDIKDIRVCEPPKPQLTLTGGLPNDPAIVQHSAAASSDQSPEIGKQCFGSVGGIATYYPSGSMGVGQTQQFIPQQPLSGSGSATPTLRKSPTMDQGVQVSGISSTPKDEKKDKKQTTPQPTPKQVAVQSMIQRQAPSIPQNKPVSRGRPRRGRGMRGGRGGFSKPKEEFDGDFSKPKEPQLKFDNDYDFEQANAEFQEMENKMMKTKISDGVPNGDDKKDDSGNETAAGEGEEEQVIYYDRSKSFFDNISCESLERSKGKLQRTDWRQERKLNAETFGVTNSYIRRGGFRGRGFRGRGGFRGGRSRGTGRGMLSNAPNMINRGYENIRPNFTQSRKPPQNWETKA